MEIRVEGVKDVAAMVDPGRVADAWIAGLRDGATRARDRAREEAGRHQRYTGRMERAPRYRLLPKASAAGTARQKLTVVGVVDPGVNSPQSYILSYGRRSRRFPNVEAISRWAARRGLTTGASMNLRTGTISTRTPSARSRVNQFLEAGSVGFLIARAIGKRGFNLQGRGDKTDNWWYRATSGLLPGQVRDDVERHLDAAR